MKASLRKWVLLVSGMAVLLFVMAMAAGTAKATGDEAVLELDGAESGSNIMIDENVIFHVYSTSGREIDEVRLVDDWDNSPALVSALKAGDNVIAEGNSEITDYIFSAPAGSKLLVTVEYTNDAGAEEDWQIGGISTDGSWLPSEGFWSRLAAKPEVGEVLTYEFDVDEIKQACSGAVFINYFNGFEVRSAVLRITGNADGCYFGKSFDEAQAGERTLYAQVKYVDDDEWVNTDPITITVDSYGQTGDFQLSVNEIEATRGEYAQFEFSSSDNAENYFAMIYRTTEDGQEYCNYAIEMDPDNRMVGLSTVYLEPGEYYLYVESKTPGWHGNRTQEVKVTVLDASDIVFDLNIEDDGQGVYELPVYRQLKATIYVPGAVYVYYAIDGENSFPNCNGQISELRSWDEESIDEEHTITLYANMGNGDFTECGSKTFRVVTYGKLEFNENAIPEVIGENEELTFTVPFPKYAVGMGANLQIYDAENDEVIFLDEEIVRGYMEWTDEKVTVRIPADAVVKNQIILFNCWANGEEGYPNTETGYMIPVMPAGYSSVATLELECGNENNQVLLDEEVRWNVNSNNGELIEGIVYFTKIGSFFRNMKWEYSSDHYSYTDRYYDDCLNRRCVMCAMVRLEGSEDFVPTDFVAFDVYSVGKVGEFDYLGPDELTLAQGEFAEFTFGEASDARDYFVYLHDEWGAEFQAPMLCNGNTVVLSTLDLAVGSYEVYGRANGEVGYEGRDANNYCVMNVTEATELNGVFVSEEEPATLEQVLVAWKIEGVARVSMKRDDREEMTMWSGDSGWSVENWGWSGDHLLTLYVSDSKEGDDDWEEYRSIPIVVHADNGPLKIDTDDVPEQIAAGSGSAVFSVPWKTEYDYMGYEYLVRDENRGIVASDRCDNTEGEGAVISIPSEDLVAGYYVELNIWVGGYNYDGMEWRANIPVVPETVDSEVTLSLKDGPDSQVLVNKDAGLVINGVNYPNVREVLLWAGEHEGYCRCRYDEGDNQILLDYWYENDCVDEDNTVFALILLDGNDDYVMTNSLSLHVGSLGEAGEFDFDILNERTVTRGEFVYYGFTVSNDATQYWVDAFDKNGSSYNPRNEGYGTSVTLSTAELPEGQYMIYGRAGGPGLQWTESDSYVILNVQEPIDNAVRINVNRDSVLTMDQVFASVLAPGAEEVGLAVVEDDYHIVNRVGGQGATFDYRWNEAGIYTLYPCARYSSNGEWEFGDGVEITVESIGPVEIDTSDVPTTITENSGPVTITIPWGEDYEYLGYEISCHDLFGNPGEFVLRYDNTYGSPAEFEIPEVWYVTGNTIELGIWAGGIGYDHTDIRISIPVVPASEGEPEVTLSLADGLTCEGILVNKDFSFVISVPDGKEIDDVLLWAADYYDRRGCSPENSGYRYWYRYDNETAGKRYNVFALVKFTDSDDYVMTNVITIHVTWFGKTGDFDFVDLESITVARGDLVSFTFTPSEDATEYWVDAFCEYQNFNPQSSHDGTTVMMSTADLEAGTYTVYGRAGNGNGWIWTESGHGVTLIVTEPENDDVIIRTGKTELNTCEDTFVSVYAPNAAKIGFVNDGRYEDMTEQEYDTWWGSSAMLNRNWDDVGIHTVEVYVVYAGSDEWTKAGEATFTVTAPRGKLTIDTSNVPTQITAGRNCEIIIPWKDEYHHFGYDMHVLDINVNGGSWTYTSRLDNTEGSNIVINIAAEYLKAGSSIELGVWAGGFGYEKADYYVDIPVISNDTVEPEATLSITEGLTNNQVYVNSEIRFVITYEEGRTIEEVRLWFDHWENWFDYQQEDDRYQLAYRVGNEYDDKVYPVFAAVRFSDSSDFVTTNVINVSVAKLGATGAFDFEDTSEVTVSRGEFAEFEFTPSEKATYYWIDAFDKDDIWYDLRSTSNGNTVTVPTALLPVGQYKLYGRAGGEPGWQWTGSQSYVILNVTEATGNDIRMTVDKSDVQTMENVNVGVFAAGALEVKVEENNFSRGWDSGESLTFSLNWGEPGQHELIVYASYGDGWVEGDHITVTVKADKGNVVLDTSDVPDYLTAGDEDVSFTIPWADDLDYLGYELRYRDPYGNIIDYIDRCDNTEGGDAVIQISEDYLVAGYALELNVWTCGLGYQHTDYHFTIPVVAPASNEVTLLLEEQETYLRHVDYNVTICVTGAESIEIYDGCQTFEVFNLSNYEGNDELPEIFDYTLNFPDAGTFTLYATAWINGEPITSEPVTVTVTTIGEAPTTEVVAPEYVLSGTDAKIQIAVPGDDLWYHVSVRLHDNPFEFVEYQYGETVGENQPYTVIYGEEFTTIVIKADELLPDALYDVEVQFDTNGGYAMTGVWKSFRVVEPYVTITTPKRQRTYGDTVPFTITAPLATSVELYKGNTKLDSFTWVADEFAPEITFTAKAYYDGFAEPFTSSITIEVLSLGAAPEPTMEVAESVLEGDVLNITVAAEEGVWYSLRVLQGENSVLQGENGADQPFSLTAGNPADGNYTVLLSYGKNGYNSVEITMTVEIIPAYTVTWLDGDGNELKSEQVAAGETPVYTGETPTKTATEQYTYTFNNTWTPEIEEVTGEATYTAGFTAVPVEYTITFVSTDGEATTTVATITQGYGTEITPPAEEPERAGFIFQGWGTELPETMPDHDMTITAVWEMEPIYLTSANVEFKGLIRMRMAFLMTEELHSRDDIYVAYYRADGTIAAKIPLKDGEYLSTPTGDAFGAQDHLISYGYYCPVRAKEFANNLYVKVIGIDGEPVEYGTSGGSWSGTAYTYSTKMYADAVLASSTIRQTMKDVATAFLDYGAAANIRFANGSAGYSVSDKVTQVTWEEMGESASYDSAKATAMGVKISLNLDFLEDNSLYVYFTLPSGKTVSDYTFTFKRNGTSNAVTPIAQGGNKYLVKVGNIAARKLAEFYDITITEKSNSANTFTVHVSALSYAKTLAQQYEGTTDPTKQKMLNLVKSLYLYWKAAAAHWGTN